MIQNYLLNKTINWKPTPIATQELNISALTLKRKRDIAGGFLVAGRHWRSQTDSPNSVVLWNVEAIQQEFAKRSITATRNAMASRALQAMEA